MQEAFLAYIQQPTPENFLAVRSAVLARPDYAPYGDGLRHLRDAYEAGEFAHMKDLFGQHLSSLLLSGEAHFIVALAHEKLGDADAGQMEKYLAFVCVKGILGTGDGSQERPYLVTSTADEYDVLNALSKRPTMQSLHHEPDRVLDRQTVDGGEIWFDVTAPFATLEKQFGGK